MPILHRSRPEPSVPRVFILISVLAASVLLVSCAEKGPIDAARQEYFKQTYDESRSDFRARCSELRSLGARPASLSVSSEKERDLTIDLCMVPAKKPNKLIIVTSGVHGIEGFTGSAVQRFWMKEQIKDLDHSGTGYLFVHAVNPFGFRLERRVTENNVDLNRNFDVTPALFSTENQGYRTIRELLNPEGRLNTTSFANRFFAIKAVYNIAKFGMRSLRQAALQGQYEFPRGIYFGGQAFEQQKGLLDPVFLREAAPYSHVMVVDLHTGYGARAKLHFFPNAIKDPAVRKRIETVYAGYQVDYGDTQDFHTTTGDFSEYVGKLLKDKKYIPMVFEYGTLDSQTTSGSIQSIHNMILENQGYWNGYEDTSDLNEIKKRFREHFYPSSQVWRTEVLRVSGEVFPLAAARFAALEN